MKLKKGSKEAKEFMRKIRAQKGKPKKSKVGAVKRSTRKVVRKNTSVLGSTQHNDTKSHNYKISISGIKTDVLRQLEDLNKKMFRYTDMKNFYSKTENTKGLNAEDKKHYKYMAETSKKHLKNFQQQINSLKKLL